MSWAQRLRRVFAIDIETCRQCGGRLRQMAASICRHRPGFSPARPIASLT
jgi:hypothetical protein